MRLGAKQKDEMQNNWQVFNVLQTYKINSEDTCWTICEQTLKECILYKMQHCYAIHAHKAKLLCLSCVVVYDLFLQGG